MGDPFQQAIIVCMAAADARQSADLSLNLDFAEQPDLEAPSTGPAPPRVHALIADEQNGIQDATNYVLNGA